ncbi:MAG: serine/threonine-protein phosphatase [Peptococcaceae bacterium]|nr:serine/threonine-protein phosphatase [Peptococcaceae bacterium]
MKLAIAARSETNVTRSNNEDNLYCAGITLTPENCNEPFVLDTDTTTPCLIAVFDGMGGMANGEYASLAATQSLSEHADIIKSEVEESANAVAVQKYVAETNQLLCRAMREKASQFGTTLALAVVTEETILSYNLGDSRIYALFEEDLKQISVDHTLAAQKVKLGVLTPEQALTDKSRHRLSLHLGVFEDEFSVMAEELPSLPRASVRRLLLCTDGMTDGLKDTDIEEVLRKAQTVSDAATQLIELALIKGRDNVTCIVLEALEPEDDKEMPINPLPETRQPADQIPADRIPTYMDNEAGRDGPLIRRVYIDHYGVDGSKGTVSEESGKPPNSQDPQDSQDSHNPMGNRLPTYMDESS